MRIALLLNMSNISNVSNNTVRRQKKNQTARQAMMISGLQTIYRNNSNSNAVKKNIQSERRIFFLDISLTDITEKYAKIHQIIENGRLRPKGTELFFLNKKHEHLIISDKCIYEIKTEKIKQQYSTHNQIRNSETNPTYKQYLQPKTLIDGETTTIEVKTSIIHDSKRMEYNIPVLVDESYFKIPEQTEQPIYTHHIPTDHIYITRVKHIIRFHNNGPNAFVFVFDENEKHIVDFYMTTENGILSNNDKLNNSFKDDMISFLLQFKLCS